MIDRIDEFPSGERFAAVVVYRRDGGLTQADRALIAQHRRELAPVATAGRPPPPAISRDGTTALNVVPFKTTGEGDIVTSDVDGVRDVVEGTPPGLQVEVTGPAGFAADAIEVFDSINGTLLAATALLVFVLLILIYRSPIFWLIPFLSVIVAEVSSRGLGYLLSELGVTVTGQTSSILTVLVFGAGTDYALLIVARYREELRRQEDKHVAVGTAMRTAGPPVVASAATVMAALLVPLVRGGQRHRRAGADRGDGDRARHARDVHDAPGAAWRSAAGAPSGPSSRTSATRAPTPRTASGGESPSGSAPGRGASGSGRPRRWPSCASVSSSSAPTSPRATSSATRRAPPAARTSSSGPSRPARTSPTRSWCRIRTSRTRCKAALLARPEVPAPGPVEEGRPGARFDLTAEHRPLLDRGVRADPGPA